LKNVEIKTGLQKYFDKAEISSKLIVA